ncbi:MAG TPA: NAD(P)H-dependent glycerol-3-phosphate dehydrogenase [Rhizomicrobium sp.]|jgi:glycerol-3-phosphate dehydrogenase (NAD(P)+)|nr:NAD(P)H-dependent glycerol-3-phosphate dehydrogenase [Rhizomicrobium sp.]
MPEAENSPDAYAHIGILGAGAWGMALAHVAARAGRAVTLWSRNPLSAEAGVSPASGVGVTRNREIVAGADAILVVVPAQRVREALAGFKPMSGAPLVICAKGIEHTTGLLMTEVLTETVYDAEPAILSGPSFAQDVVAGLPTAVTIAARAPIARRLQASLGHATFRPYASEDLPGVALGGAAKNVYAIACGIVIGLGLGESARAGLLARSFAELCRLAQAFGARNDTLMGLSGFGDLVLTATSPASRNFSFGLALGHGYPLAQLRAPGAPLAEGVETAPALVARAGRLGIELPVAHAVMDILAGGIAPAEAVPRLMARPFRME